MKMRLKRLNKTLSVAGIGVGFFLLNSMSLAQTGGEIFKQNCAVCHKLGGKMVGPDLVGVSDRRSEDWIIKFVKSSQSMVKSGDAAAKAIFEEFNQVPMPDQALNNDQIKAVISYVNEKGVEILASKTTNTEEILEEITYSDEQIAVGKALFEGATRFVNSGPSCVSCHNVSSNGVIAGGLLAKDLTNVYARMGEAGIGGILSAPPFPAMTSSYGNNKLTEEEIVALAAFFSKVDADSKINPVSNTGHLILLVGGGVGLALLLVVIYFSWNFRKKRSVKHEIFERQLKSIY